MRWLLLPSRPSPPTPDPPRASRTSRSSSSISARFSVSCLLLGDIIGGKVIRTPFGPISVGIIPFPVTFLLTDIVNDFYGRRGARFLTMLGFYMALLAWVLLQGTTLIPVDSSTYYTQAEFAKVFGGSAQLFVASMVAYLIGQFLDIHIFACSNR